MAKDQDKITISVKTSKTASLLRKVVNCVCSVNQIVILFAVYSYFNYAEAKRIKKTSIHYEMCQRFIVEQKVVSLVFSMFMFVK